MTWDEFVAEICDADQYAVESSWGGIVLREEFTVEDLIKCENQKKD